MNEMVKLQYAIRGKTNKRKKKETKHTHTSSTCQQREERLQTTGDQVYSINSNVKSAFILVV